MGHHPRSKREGKEEEEDHDGEDRIGTAAHQKKVLRSRVLNVVPELVEVVSCKKVIVDLKVLCVVLFRC